MDRLSPYLPPSLGGAEHPSGPPVMEPAAVKPFAIIHLVFAGIGFLWGLYAVVSPLFARMMLGALAKNIPAEQRASFERTMDMQASVAWIGVLSGVFMLALAVMLLVAGVKLLRRRSDGLAWSNAYAWTSIATKLISAALAAIFILPMQREMMRIQFESMPGSPSSRPAFPGQAFGTFAGALSLVFILLACTYPILSLCFLNKPAVKAWLGAK